MALDGKVTSGHTSGFEFTTGSTYPDLNILFKRYWNIQIKSEGTRLLLAVAGILLISYFDM